MACERRALWRDTTVNANCVITFESQYTVVKKEGSPGVATVADLPERQSVCAGKR